MTQRASPVDVPVLDLAQASLPDGSRNPDFLCELREVARRVGSFQIVDCGTDLSVLRRLLSTLDEFFGRPVEEREAITHLNSPAFCGYTSLGKEVTRARP